MQNFIFKCKAGSRLCAFLLAFAALFFSGSATAQCTGNPPGNGITQPYGQDTWTGYVFTGYANDANNTPVNAFSATYRGYITEDSTSFEHNYGEGTISGDSLCGTYADHFAVRYKMKKTFVPGYYRFRTGGDDGVRLSLDGGTTFVTPVDSWTNHSYLTYDYYLLINQETELNLVIEYYEFDVVSRIGFEVTPLDCYATAPTEVTGNVIYSCNANTTLTATGGTTGAGTNYQWGTGTTVGQNIISGDAASIVVTQPGAYWVRRHMGGSCNIFTDALLFNVTTSGTIPGNPAVYGDNTWRVYGYHWNNADFPISEYKGFYVQDIDSETNLGFDTDAAWNRDLNPSVAAGWEGCSVGVNNNDFSFIHKRQGFPCGEYQLIAQDWDDNMQVYVDGQLVYSVDGWSAGNNKNILISNTTFILGPDSKIEVRVREWGGGANAQIDIVPVSKQPTAVTGAALVCAGSPVTLTAQGGVTGSIGAYQWGTGTPGQNIIQGQTGASITVSPIEPTTYWVRIAFSQCGTTTGVATTTVEVQNSWTGALNHDWHNAANWCGGVPTLNQPVIIPVTDNDPEVTLNNAAAKNLTVNAGASVTVKTNGTLTVKDAVANNGILTVQNNAALVQVNNVANTGVATVVRNSNPLYRLDYTMWGSPVAGQNLKNFSPFTSTNPSRFYTYGVFTNTTTGQEQEGYVTADYNAAFQPGAGYLIRMPNSLPGVNGYNQGTATYVHEGPFTGVPNNGPVEVTVGTQVGYYIAVANPYPSPISVVAFFEDNQDVIESGNGIYFWRKRNNSANSSYGHLSLAGYDANGAEGGSVGGGDYYDVPDGAGTGFNENWIIAPGQGFLVKVKASATPASKVVFNNGMRKEAPVNGQPFFRTLNNNTTNTAPAVSRWWIDLTNNGEAFAQTLVAYIPQATTGLDYGYDAKMLADGGTKVYSKTTAGNMAIQARPSFTNTDVVPMGFTVSAAGQYAFSLSKMDGVFAQGQDIFIKDNLLGTVSNLKLANYNFTSDAGTFDTRFEVIYQPQGQLGTNSPSLENTVMVYQSNGVINITTGTVEMKAVTLYDVRGRKIYSQAGINGTDASISGLGAAQQVLIVEIDTVNGNVSKKIVY